MKTLQTAAAVILALALSGPVLAQPRVTVQMAAEKEIRVEENGRQIVRRVAAEDILPGEALIYTLQVANSGDEEARNVVIDNPVPEASAYIDASAFGANSRIAFSIDGGATYKQPAQLTYTVQSADGRQEKRTATPESYTHIRWVIETIPPGGRTDVGFQVRVK